MRTTLLSMALLAAASTAFAQDAEMKTGVVLSDPGYGDLHAPVYLNAAYSCSQMLYTGSEMDAAAGSLATYTVKQLYFPFKGSLSDEGTAKIKVYMAKSSLTSLPSVQPMDDFTLVFNGDIEFTPGMPGMTIELDAPFVMNRGDGLLIASSAEAGGIYVNFEDPWPQEVPDHGILSVKILLAIL